MVGGLRAGLGDTGLSCAAIEARVERFVAMGTRIELHLFGGGDTDALAQARSAIEAVDDALTIHRPSPTTAINYCLAAGRGAPVEDPILLDALAAVEAAWAMTEGLFDPTVGRAGGETGGWPLVTFDRLAGRIEAARPLAFDFGGFGKGYALDCAADALLVGGATSAFLSAGESSIVVLGGHPLGGKWPLTIPHPFAPEETLVALELEDEALSISSTVGAGAQAPWRAPMVRPIDGAIVTAAATTVAVERSGAAAEAMSTALLVADEVAGRRLGGAAPGRRHLFLFADDSSMSRTSAGSIE